MMQGLTLSPHCILQASQPSALKTAREGGGFGSATSVPIACPPACSPASTNTRWVGSEAWHRNGSSFPPTSPTASLKSIKKSFYYNEGWGCPFWGGLHSYGMPPPAGAAALWYGDTGCRGAHWQHLGFLRGADRYRSLSVLPMPAGCRG